MLIGSSRASHERPLKARAQLESGPVEKRLDTVTRTSTFDMSTMLQSLRDAAARKRQQAQGARPAPSPLASVNGDDASSVGRMSLFSAVSSVKSGRTLKSARAFETFGLCSENVIDENIVDDHD